MKISTLIPLLAITLLATVTQAVDKPPRIVHEPVKAGIKGQPVYIRATVTDDQGPARSVNLFCSVSSDSAPFKVPMRASGAGAFIAAIPANLVQNAAQVSYYIEAVDSLDQSTETPWYTIKFRIGKNTSGGKAVDTQTKSSWKKPLVITAGAAAAIGIGVAVAGSGSDDSGDATPPAGSGGVFVGNATKILRLDDGTVTVDQYEVTFNLFDNNYLYSGNLHAGALMNELLVNNAFDWDAPVSENDLTGSVKYTGTVDGNTIDGRISGRAETATGTNGITYSGQFSATKQ